MIKDLLVLNLSCFLTGSILGIIFTLLKLPLPAPPVFSGVIGIIGVWFGYYIINRLF